MGSINRISLHRLYEFAESLPDYTIKNRSYASGETIYEKETYAKGLFYLDSGTVVIKTIAPNGHEDVTRIFGSHHFFGFLPLIQRTRYTSTAIALEDSTQVRFIPRAIVSEALNDQRFVIGFLKIMANRIKDNQSHLLHLKNKNALERLAHVLMALDQVFKKRVKDPPPMISLKKKELASYIGITPETLSRRLADLEKDALIELHLKGIRVVRHKELASVAAGHI